MVIKQFHSKDGIIEREITLEEVQHFAGEGDRECLKELAKQELKKSLTVEERLTIIENYLGLK